MILYILLSGTHPFHTTTLFDQITHASYSMAGPEWEHISAGAKDLVRKLLTESPKARLTAEQALAHPFITACAGAAASAARAAAQPPPPPLPPPAPSPSVATRGHAATRTSPSAGTRSSGGGRRGGEVAERAGAAAAGRSSSQDTDISSTSADDVSPTTSSSLSPAEGGGGSAKPAPAGSAGSPGAALPMRAGVAPELLPPPQPRGHGTAAAGITGGGGGRRRSKKDGVSDKAPYSQLQMHVVGVGGSDEGGTMSPEAAEVRGAIAMRKESSRDDGNGVQTISDQASVVAIASANGNAGFASSLSAQQANGMSCASRAKASEDRGRGVESGAQVCSPSSSSFAQHRQQELQYSSAVADSPGGGGGGGGGRPNGRGKRKASATTSTHNALCTTATKGRPPPARRLSAGGGDSTADLTADDIIEYSSEDSPAKRTRARVGGRSGGQGARGGRASSQPAGARTGAAQQQTHLKVGDGGKLNLSKLVPLSRAGAGSAGAGVAVGASGAGERSRRDRAAQAVAGGAAASGEDCVGGGGPAGGGAAGAAAAGTIKGKGSKQQPKGGGKPQRTMTHLWKRAAGDAGGQA